MMRKVLFSAVVVVTATASLRALQGQPEPSTRSTTQDLVLRVRHALKVPGKAWAATAVSGKQVKGGIEQAYSFAFRPDGRFVQSFQGSNAKTFGNDGRRYWKEDRSHFVQELQFGSRDLQMAINLFLSGNWLLGSAPIRLSAAGDSVIRLVFNETGVGVDVRIDSKTDLPVAASFQIADGAKLAFSDWHVAGDRKLPFHVDVTIDGVTESYIADAVKAIRPEDVHAEMPKSNLTDVTFDPAKPASVESGFAGTTHIRVRALVNGRDVGWFILDSGAGAMLIDKAIADSLHLERLDRGSATSVGGSFELTARTVRTFEIGPMTLHDVRMRDYDFSAFNSGSGPRIAGIIGTPLFRRAVVVVNWKGPAVELYDRGGFKLKSGTWQTLRFNDDNPAVLATAAGTPPAWYVLDTGGSGFVTFHTPFVERWKLLQGRETTPSTSTGLGGATKSVSARTGKIEWFRVGSHRFDNPTVVFSTTKSGGMAESYLAGYVGLDALKFFTLVFDFTGSRVAFLGPDQVSRAGH